MKIIRDPFEFYTLSCALKSQGSIGFVPTMGALHQGHASLVRKAAEENDFVTVSIFVNPLQFNNPDDLVKYPRTEAEDLALLETLSVAAVFIPEASLVYQQATRLAFDFGTLERVMEGTFRPGHFNGVATVVAKLFHWANPSRAYFGQKDIQQVRIIETLIEDLSFPIQLIRCETLREANGLAMSSRNRRLSEAGKEIASQIYQQLLRTQNALGKIPIGKLKDQYTEALTNHGIQVEYIEICDYKTLMPLDSFEKGNPVLICTAVYLEGVRLIDNIVV
ncbi:MAG: pantoate--beta-alanine ligase [Cytophagaceae bacterium]|jgi:pantoate--beta-alanine ligase|nr:pantoate--beta-alanine ligase [Cytophagaceae bacterium]